MVILKANKDNFLYLLEYSIKRKRPIIFPTDTIYGIGATINNLEANEFIYKVKSREVKKSFPILIGSIKQLDMIAEHISQNQLTIIKKFWPGPITFILKAKKGLNNIYKENNKVAVRLPKLTWICGGLKEINSPITASSANISGESYVNDIEQIINTFKTDLSLYLYNVIRNTQPSTIIDISEEENIKFIRNPSNLSLGDVTFK